MLGHVPALQTGMAQVERELCKTCPVMCGLGCCARHAILHLQPDPNGPCWHRIHKLLPIVVQAAGQARLRCDKPLWK